MIFRMGVVVERGCVGQPLGPDALGPLGALGAFGGPWLPPVGVSSFVALSAPT